jgi:hypothetical protein
MAGFIYVISVNITWADVFFHILGKEVSSKSLSPVTPRKIIEYEINPASV